MEVHISSTVSFKKYICYFTYDCKAKITKGRKKIKINICTIVTCREGGFISPLADPSFSPTQQAATKVETHDMMNAFNGSQHPGDAGCALGQGAVRGQGTEAGAGLVQPL